MAEKFYALATRTASEFTQLRNSLIAELKSINLPSTAGTLALTSDTFDSISGQLPAAERKKAKENMAATIARKENEFMSFILLYKLF